MSETGIRRYLSWSSALTLVTGLALLALTPFFGWSAVGWSALGWLLMALIGVFGGAWTATLLGSDGMRFFVALIACMLSRMTLALGGVVLIMLFSRESIVFYLLGLVVGFLPLQIFESSWISRRAKTISGTQGQASDPLVAR